MNVTKKENTGFRNRISPSSNSVLKSKNTVLKSNNTVDDSKSENFVYAAGQLQKAYLNVQNQNEKKQRRKYIYNFLSYIYRSTIFRISAFILFCVGMAYLFFRLFSCEENECAPGCICCNGYRRIDGVCSCSSTDREEIEDPEQGKECVLRCKVNEQRVGRFCECRQGYELMNGKCGCALGKQIIDGECVSEAVT